MKPIVKLDAENGLPMKELEGKVEFYRGPEDAHSTPIGRSGREDAGKYRSIIRQPLPDLFCRWFLK